METIIISQKLYLRLIFVNIIEKKKIFYINKNYLSKISQFLKLSNIKKITWKIEDIKVNNQIILTEIIENKKVDNFIYQYLNQLKFEKNEQKNFINYLIKFFSNHKSIGNLTVENFLVFFKASNILFKQKNKIFYIENSTFNFFIKKNFSDKNNKFKFVGLFDWNFFYILKYIVKKLLHGSFKKKNSINDQFKIAVLDSYEINQPKSFFPNSFYKNVLFLSDKKDNLENNIINFYNYCSPFYFLFIIKFFFESLLNIKKGLLINCLFVQFKFEEKIFYEIFKKFKVKKFITSYIAQVFSSSAVSAIDKINGSSYGFTTSFSEDYSSHLNIDAYDNFFSFNNCNYIKTKNSKLKKIFNPGYICDYKFAYKKSKAEEFRLRLTSNGIKYIIGFFDQGYSADSMFQMGYHISDRGYQFLLNKILTHEDIGIIIKPKKPKILNLKLSKTSNDLLEKAINSKKCILLNDHADHHVKNFEDIPAQVAMASDITIHDTLLAGTAALESALVGCKSLMFDYFGAKQSLFKQNNLDIVYTDWNLLWTKIIENKNKQSNNNFGDWSEIIKKFDPYMDGKANQRIIDILSNE